MSQWELKSKTDEPMNMSQWELKVKTDKRSKVLESASDYIETGLSFDS